MPTALELIESSAIKLGAKATGEALTADEANDSLSILNSMLEAMGIDEMMVYQIKQDTYTWTAGQASRTIGPSGNLNGVRPVKIDSAFFRENGIDYPVNILQLREEYDSIPYKTDVTNYPTDLFYDPAYPLGVIYAYPVPTSNIAIYINYWQPLQSFASLTTDLAMPPGYRWMIENNLAVALESVFSVPVPASVVKAAVDSMAAIKRVNHRPIMSRNDAACMTGGGYDIYSGEIR